jgi:hypothetical protein
MPSELHRIARLFWPIAAGVLLGLAIGGVWTLFQSDRYRAETHLLLRGGATTRLSPAVVTLANGSVVQENVRQTLRLSRVPDLSARLDRNILVVFAEAGSRDRARQVDAEAAQVITQLVAARFGSEGLRTSLLDPAHVVDQPSPTPVRNLLVAGLLGLVVGGAFAYPRWRRRVVPPAVGGAVDPDVERRLKQRVGEVTKRERALARRAGELAEREAKVEKQREKLEELEARLKQRAAELGETKQELAGRADDIAADEKALEARAAEPPPPPPPPPPPEPEPALALSPPPDAASEPAVRMGSWNMNDLQRVVDSQTSATPEQVEEWTTYLFFLREHAASDGSLPRQFDGLVEDVFGELI